MDLRIVKTKRAIKSAFLDMRRDTPLEKVKVRDLCRMALINKSTFYSHYEDVFALSDELEDEAIAQILDDFDEKDELFERPRAFLEGIQAAIDRNQEVCDSLFSGRQHVMFRKLEGRLREHYANQASTDAQRVLVAFVTGGAMFSMHALLQEGMSPESITAATIEAIGALAELRGDGAWSSMRADIS